MFKLDDTLLNAVNDALYDPTPRYIFSRGFVHAFIDCSECKNPLTFRFSWKEIMDGINKGITRFYGSCSCFKTSCFKTITFDIDKETLQGFTAESVLEAFEET